MSAHRPRPEDVAGHPEYPAVRRIVEQHDGTIGVVSEKGRGTSFTLTLPLVQEVTGTRTPSAEEEPA